MGVAACAAAGSHRAGTWAGRPWVTCVDLRGWGVQGGSLSRWSSDCTAWIPSPVRHAARRTSHAPFWRDLSDQLPDAGRLEFRTSGDADGPRMVLDGRTRDSLEARAEGGELTPVMARLGPVDLETLDALITAGIAASRAEAVRWALARPRERPAYAQLRERAAEIERLKTEF